MFLTTTYSAAGKSYYQLSCGGQHDKQLGLSNSGDDYFEDGAICRVCARSRLIIRRLPARSCGACNVTTLARRMPQRAVR